MMKRSLLGIAALMSLAVACAPQPVTPTTTAEPGLYELLTAGNHAAVRSYPLSTEELARLRAKDQRLGFALTRVLINQGLSAAALFVANEELAFGTAPWSGYAAAEVTVDLIARERWTEAATLARGALLSNPHHGDLHYALGHALYQQQRFVELSAYLAQPTPADLLFVRVSAGDWEAERLIWAAVSAVQDSAALNPAERAARLAHPFMVRAAGPLHRRLYLYMTYNRVGLSDLSGEARRLVEAVYRTATEEWAEAARLFALIRPAQVQPILDQYDGSLIAVSRSARQAFERAGQASAGARWLEGVAADLDPSLRRLVLTEAATAHLAAREAARARAIMTQVINETGTEDAARTDWIQLWLRAAEQLTLLEQVDGLITFGSAAASVAQTIERHLSPLVAERSFAEIAQLYRLLPTGHTEARLHLALILIAAAEAGLVGEAELTDQAIDRYLLAELARNVHPGSYYRLAADAVLNVPVALWETEDRRLSEVGGAESATPIDPHGAERWARAEALLTVGLPRESFTAVWRLALDPHWADRAISYARGMSAWGDVPGALDLSRRAIARRGSGPQTAEISYLYPLAYRHEILAVSAQAQIDAALFFAIVREESHFAANARSWVGAIGLSQLMSATAADMATRLRLNNPNLDDPWTNLHIGAQYLGYLQRLIPHQLLAIASYNAGLGRGRTWNERFGDLPAVLLIEAIPFHETRNYLRKVVNSWVYYRYALTGADPGETTAAIFAIQRGE